MEFGCHKLDRGFLGPRRWKTPAARNKLVVTENWRENVTIY